MNYQDLKELIQPTESKLVLNHSDFSDSDISRLLSAFFDGAHLDVVGAQVTPDDEAKEINLKGKLNNAFLGIVALQNKVQLDATFSLLGDVSRVVIRLTFIDGWNLTDALTQGGFSVLSGDLTDGVRRRFNFPITEFVLDSALFSLEIGVEPNLSLNLNDAAQYIQGLSIVDQFPTSGFPSFVSSLTIASFKIAARVSPMVLTYLEMELALGGGGTWEPVGDLIRFKDLRAQVLLVNPLAFPAASITVSTTAEISGTDIVASIELPSRDFQCYLAEGEKINITSLIADIIDVPVPLPRIECTAFSVSGEPRNSSYEFSATIESHWEIIPNLWLTELSGNFTLLTHPERSTEAEFSGSITFGSSEFFVSAYNEPGETGWRFTGGIAENSPVNVSGFVDELLDAFGIDSNNDAVASVKEILGALTISQLDVSFHTQTKDFSFACLMEFTLDSKPSNLQLNIELTNMVGRHRISFDGILYVGVRQFNLSFETSKEGASSSTFLFAGFANPEGEEIDLITQIVDVVSNDYPLSFPAPDENFDLRLTTLILYELQLTYQQEKMGKDISKNYGIKGKFAWEPQIDLTGETSEPIRVLAQVDLHKRVDPPDVTDLQNKSKVLGTVCGEIQSTIEGLEFLALRVCYDRNLVHPDQPQSATNGLTDKKMLQLTIGRITFNAVYNKKENGNVSLEFSTDAEGGALTLGDVVTFFASLVDPSIDEFEFEPPWNFITEYNLANILDSIILKLEIFKATREKKFSIAFSKLNNLVPREISTFLTINKLSLEYSSLTKQTNIILDAVFLGQQQPRLGWDPINQAPPEIPGQGASVFELRYLGMGQHVTFENINRLDNISSVMRALEDSAIPLLPADKNKNPLKALAAYPSNPSAPAVKLVFSPESEWLIGLDVSLLKTVNLMVIFNDPVIYGLRIELYGELAKSFAGLQFEILYQRISDTLGKYHTELTLPDRFRYLQVGAVSITLPVVVVDIFTNGDFKVDLGFPWNFNFARSFAIEVFPFTGAGGFYFNKLSAATTTLVPTGTTAEQIAERGVFTPVYEFGLGFQIGLGKSFHRGPLKAEIRITVQGIITGVISWYNPIEAAGKKELYYKIAGGVAIVGRLYGEVDFGIISVSVEVVARAMIIFVVEVYQPIHILLAADVSVKASVKVAFITVSFSFSMRVEQEFTIPSPQGDALPPWVQ